MFSGRSHSNSEDIKVSSKSHSWLRGKSSLADPVWCRGYRSRAENKNNGRTFQDFSTAASLQRMRHDPRLEVITWHPKGRKYLWPEWRAPKGKRNSVWERASGGLGAMFRNLTSYGSYFTSSRRNNREEPTGFHTGLYSHSQERTNILKEPLTAWQSWKNIYWLVFQVGSS